MLVTLARLAALVLLYFLTQNEISGFLGWAGGGDNHSAVFSKDIKPALQVRGRCFEGVLDSDSGAKKSE